MAQHILAKAQVCQGLLEPCVYCIAFWDMLLSPVEQIVSLMEVPCTCINRNCLQLLKVSDSMAACLQGSVPQSSTW